MQVISSYLKMISIIAFKKNPDPTEQKHTQMTCTISNPEVLGVSLALPCACISPCFVRDRKTSSESFKRKELRGGGKSRKPWKLAAKTVSPLPSLGSSPSQLECLSCRRLDTVCARHCYVDIIQSVLTALIPNLCIVSCIFELIYCRYVEWYFILIYM